MECFIRKLLTLCLILFTLNSWAGTSQLIVIDCPIGEGKAVGKTRTSYSQFNTGLDFLPIGPGAFPVPPPECEENGFFVYKKNFSKDEVKKLENFIFSDDYQNLVKNENVSSFFKLAKIYEYMEYPILDYYDLYLVDIWKLGEAENSEEYKKTANQIIRKYEKVLVTIGLYPDTSKHLVYINYLLAELYRRIGEFEKAAEKIEWASKNNSNNLDNDFIDFQRYLINKKNSKFYLIKQRKKIMN